MTSKEAAAGRGTRARREWVVDAARESDHRAWRALYDGYLDFYEVADKDRVADTVWSWIHDPGVDFECLLVRDPADGQPAGLAHYRPFLRPLRGSTACFLDDLFVAPAARGTGAVDALLSALRELAAARGWDAVRWLTRQSNARARSTYDRLARATDLVTYELRADR